MVACGAIAEIDDGDNGGSIVVASVTKTQHNRKAACRSKQMIEAEKRLQSVDENSAKRSNRWHTAESNMTAESQWTKPAMEVFLVVCNQNLDATVGEAACWSARRQITLAP